MKTKQALSKKARRAARKLFPSAKSSTRPFTGADYTTLPKGDKQ